LIGIFAVSKLDYELFSGFQTVNLSDEIPNNSQGCWWRYQNGRKYIIPGDRNAEQ
jgi:hypothetical protein